MTPAELLLAAGLVGIGLVDCALRLAIWLQGRRRERREEERIRGLRLVAEELLRRLNGGHVLLDVTGSVERQRSHKGAGLVYRLDGSGTMRCGGENDG